MNVSDLISVNYLLLLLIVIIVIIPYLTDVAAQNNEAPNLTQRRDVAHVLLEAYKGLAGCCILMTELCQTIDSLQRTLFKLGPKYFS